MNAKQVFWIPAVLRLTLLFISCAFLAFLFTPAVGISTLITALTALAVFQLNYLYRLNLWLLDPQKTQLPDGMGAWAAIFPRLHKMHRNEEKNRNNLTNWLSRFRQAMSLLPDGVVIMDDVLFLEWCNPAAETHLGLQRDRDNGMRITNLIRNPEFIDYVILGNYEKPLAITVRNRRLIVHLIPFEDRRQILVTHDATETERIEVMRRDFVANASHELRTPLTVINGFLEIAAHEELDQKTKAAHIQLMREQGQRMQNLITDMLVLTRLESFEYEAQTNCVPIYPLMKDLHAEALALSAGKHEISMSFEGPDIIGSDNELRSAFGNLISNAIRYTPTGGRIRIAWQAIGDGTRFSVSDTGIGIAQEHIPRLTERFYRVDKTRSRETHGTGLGLAIVKHVLLRHGSSLEVQSAPGNGSTFAANFAAKSVCSNERHKTF